MTAEEQEFEVQRLMRATKQDYANRGMPIIPDDELKKVLMELVKQGYRLAPEA